MAGPDGTFDAEFNLSGGEEDVARIARLMEESLERAFAKASASFQADMKKATQAIFGGGASSGRGGFDAIAKSTERLNERFLRTTKLLETIDRRLGGIRNNASDSFDIDALALANRNLERLGAIADEDAESLARMGREGLRAVDILSKTASRGTFGDLGFQQVAEAAARRQTDLIIANQRQQTREADRQSKERIVLAQQEGSRTLAEIRAASARRVAILQTANQQIRALERGLGAVFRGTADAIGASFRGLGSILSGSVGRVRTSTQAINNEMTRSFSTSLETRESLLSRSFRSQERSLSTSVNRQITQLDRLETRMSSGVIGAATGRSAAAGALGFGGISAIAGGAGIAGLLASGFQRFSDIERLNKQFLALTGNLDTTQTLMQQIKDFAAITPFDLVGVADLAKGFLAIGTAAEDVLPQVKTIADAVALTGGGTDELTRIQRAIGQVVSAGRLQGDELNQLAENLPGLNIRQILADQLTGGDVQALVAMQEAGELSADAFVGALMAGLGGDPRLQGAAEQLATTLSGRFANLKEQFSDFGASLIGLVAKPVATVFAGVSDGLTNINQFIKGEDLTPFLENLRVAAGGAAAALGGLVVAKVAGEALQFLGFALRIVMTPMGLLVTAVGAIGAAIAVLSRNSPAFAAALERTGEILGDAFSIIKDVAGTVFTTVTEAVGVSISSIGEFGDFLADKLTTVNDILGRFVTDRLRPLLEGIVEWIKTTAIPALGVAFGAVSGFITDTVVPGIVSGFRFVRDKVVPVIADIAVAIAGYAVDAGKAIADFAVDVAAFARANDELFSILGGAAAGFALAGPVGAGLGAALGAIVSNFEKIRPVVEPALSALEDFIETVKRAGIGEAFADLGSGLLKSLGNIGGVIRSTLADVFNAIRDFFSPERLRRIAFNFLDLVEEIGRIIGSTVTNPKFVAGVAAIVASFVGAVGLIVFRFGEGLVRGIAQNLDRWVRIAFSGLGAALVLAFTEVVRNPQNLLLALGGLFLGSKILSLFRSSGTQAGTAFSSGLRTSLAGGAFAGGGTTPGASGGLSSFLTSLFGGETAVRAQADRIGQSAARAIASQRSVLIAAGRDLGSGSSEAIRNAYTQLERDIGPSGINGLRLRTAVQRTMSSVFGAIGGVASGSGQAIAAFTSSFGNIVQTATSNVLALFRTNPQLSEFRTVASVAGENAGHGLRDGLRRAMSTVGQGFQPLRDAIDQLRQEKTLGQIGLALGRNLATGIAAGFAGFQTGRAVAQSGSGIDTLLGIVGITATGFAVGGPVVGAITGAAATIGAAFGRTGKAAEDAAAQVREYTDALKGASNPADRLAAVIGVVNTNLEKEETATLQLLDRLGFGVREFSDAALDGEPALRNYVATLIEGLGAGGREWAGRLRDGSISLHDFNKDVEGGVGAINSLEEAVEAAGIDYGTFIKAIDILSDENNEMHAGFEKSAALFDLNKVAVTGLSDVFGKPFMGLFGDQVDTANAHMVDLLSAAGSGERGMAALGSAAAAGGAQIDIISSAASSAQTSFEDTTRSAEELAEETENTRQAIFDFFNTDFSDSVTGLLNDLTLAIPDFGDQIVATFEDPEMSERIRLATQTQIQDAFREDIEADVTTILKNPDFVLADLDSYIAGAKAEVQAALDAGEITPDVATRANMLIDSVVQDPTFRSKLQELLDAQLAENPPVVDVGIRVRERLIPETLSPEERKRRIRSAIESGRDAAGRPIGDGPAMGFAGGATGGTPEFSIDVPVAVNPQLTIANFSSLPTLGANMVKAVAGGVVGAGQLFVSAVAAVVNAGLRTGANAYNAFFGVGANIGRSFSAGLASIGYPFINTLAAAINTGLRVAASSYRAWYGVGVNMGTAIAAGIAATVNMIARSAAYVVQSAIYAAQSTAKIKSPSQVFRDMGEFMGEGLALGINDTVDRVRSAATAMAGEAIAVVQSVNTAGQAPVVTGNDVRGMIEASGGTANTTVTLQVGGNIYGDQAFRAMVDDAMNELGQAVAARPRYARAGG